MFPNSGPVTRPLELTPSLLTGSPGRVTLLSSGTMGGLRLPASFPDAHCVRYPVPLRPPLGFRSLWMPVVLIQGPGTLLTRASRFPGLWAVETTGSPMFPKDPVCICPAHRPRADRKRQAIQHSQCCPRAKHGEGSTDYLLSGLNHTAFALPVYASCRQSLTTTQDSVPVSGLPFRVGLIPTGS